MVDKFDSVQNWLAAFSVGKIRHELVSQIFPKHLLDEAIFIHFLFYLPAVLTA